MKVPIIILLVTLISVTSVTGQEFSVMFYNVENLFDTVDDTTRDDNEFLPEGTRRWTEKRYRQKISALSKAIAAAGEWELPSLIGLCEVENEEVLKDLVFGTILSAGNYGIVHRESPDARGIDLALLYRREHFSVAGVQAWLPENPDSIPVSTRNLLYVKVTRGADTLHLVLCHLPSRRGGVLAAEGLRERMIRLAGSRVDSIMSVTGRGAAVIVMGDFNANPEDDLMLALTEGSNLVNLAANLSGNNKGSYKYQGKWEMIDQVLVSPAMLDSAAVFYTQPGCFRVVDAPFLLTEDETYPGMKPFPTYGGYRWSGGYSDHLPVLVKMNHGGKLTDPGYQALSCQPLH